MTPEDTASAFNLAVAVFAGPSLGLADASPAARRVLGLETTQADATTTGTTAADVFLTWANGQPDADDATGHSPEVDLRATLDALALRSQAVAWGEGVDLDYVFQSGASRELRKATVLVTSTVCASLESPSPSTAYTVLFLRPAKPPPTPTGPLPRSPALAGAILSPPASEPPSRPPSKSPYNPPSEAVSASEESVPPSPARSYSSSSAQSDSSMSRRRRVVTGEDRANLPVSPEARSALATVTATSRVCTRPAPYETRLSPTMSSLDLSDPSLSRTSSSSAAMSSPAPPTGTADSSRRQSFAASSASTPRANNSPIGAPEGGDEPLPAQALGQLTDDLRTRDVRLKPTFEQLVDTMATMPTIVFLTDPTGQLLWISDGWYQYTGMDEHYRPSVEEWVDKFHPDDLDYALGVYLGAMKSGEDFAIEYRIKDAHGVFRWHMCEGRAHRDSEGEITFWVANINKVDRLVKTRHDALLVKERTKAVLAGSELTLLTIDTDLRVTFFEGKWPPFNFKSHPPKLVGERFHDLCADQDLREGVRKVLDGEDEVVQVQTVTDDGKGGKRHTRYRLVPLVGDPSIPASHPDATAIAGCIAVGVDVSERIRAEEELEKTRSQAAELKASELAAREASRLKTDFLTTISHEIRTPIAGILGICELLLADSDRLAEDQRALVEKGVRSAEILLDLVGAVLDFRKVETGELKLEAKPFRLSDLLADASLFGVLAQKKGLEFAENVDVSFEGALLGDRLCLRQILANALGNSVKFTREGKVSLNLKQLSEDDSRVVVRFEICDTGLGIDEDVLPTLFTPFKQASAGTAREYGGSGLGLSITKNLVELMDGAIDLSSTLGEGSRMTITIPFNKAPASTTSQGGAADGEEGHEDVEERRRGRRPEDVRVLLAEDNELISEIVNRQLRKAGFVVDAVHNGQEAVDKVQQHEFSVVLMDGQMPGVDGYEATKQIRRSCDPRIRDLPIVALTASAIAGDRERCLDAGMSTYLAKPVRAKELEATIWEQVELAQERQRTTA